MLDDSQDRDPIDSFYYVNWEDPIYDQFDDFEDDPSDKKNKKKRKRKSQTRRKERFI